MFSRVVRPDQVRFALLKHPLAARDQPAVDQLVIGRCARDAEGDFFRRHFGQAEVRVDDGVIVRGLVPKNLPLRGLVLLHRFVAVEVIGRQVQVDADVRPEFGDLLQLK